MGSVVPPPRWVPGKERPSGGRDFLGLRTAAERIGYALMDGVTTVTPHVRYLSFRTWMLHRYWEQRRPDDRGAFGEFAQQVEAALVLGNLLCERGNLYLVGADEAERRLGSATDPVELTRLVVNPAAEIYAGTTLVLGLETEVDGQNLRGPTAGSGQPLARLVDASLRQTALGRRLSEHGPPETASRHELRAFGERAFLDRLIPEERDHLVALLFPDGEGQPRRRLTTNTLLLWLASAGSRPGEDDVFRVALEGGRALPEVLHPALDGWALFCVRDLLVTAHEAVMRSVTDVLADKHTEDQKPEEVVARLLSDKASLSRPLRELGLVGDLDDMTWSDLVQAVKRRTEHDAWTRSGLLRWADDLDEREIWTRSLNPSCEEEPVVLLAVAWAVVLRRVGPGRSGRPGPLFDHLDSSWLPLTALEETSARWTRSETLLAEVFSELIVLTVEGHLDVAWARMQENPRSDGLFIHSDGATWRARTRFNADHAASRINRQVGWMEQLDLLDAKGLTERGRAELAAALERLG